jgi:NitT/TauT family transport system ATP-binding protein
MPSTPSATIELKDISHTFTLESGQKIRVLKEVNLTLNPKEVLSILGPSGSGKSTCIRILAGLLKPARGKVFFRGQPATGTNTEISMVFQNFSLLPWMNVAENVALGLEPEKLPKVEVDDRVKKALDLVGLEGFEEAYPRELSGGMKQRVGIARALVMERPILCLDEPFSSLDILAAETLRREVMNLWLSKKTSIESIVLITHNITEAVLFSNRILVMGSNPGQIKISIKNDLPYPRDEKSAAFKRLVESLHDVITEAIIPDTPDWIPPSLAASLPESIPPVHLNEMIGFVELIQEQGGRADAFALAKTLQSESIQILLMAKSAELLDFVDTPRNSIILTDLGRRFVQSDVNVRKRIMHESLKQLRLIQLMKERLEANEDVTIPYEDALAAIQEWLPSENAEKVLDTLIEWTRYGEIFGYNDDTASLYLDRGEPTG